jgi:hypothetical protein
VFGLELLSYSLSGFMVYSGPYYDKAEAVCSYVAEKPQGLGRRNIYRSNRQ